MVTRHKVDYMHIIKTCSFSGKAEQDNMQLTSISKYHRNIQASNNTGNAKYEMLSEEKTHKYSHSGGHKFSRGVYHLPTHCGPTEQLIKLLWVFLLTKWFMGNHVIYLLSYKIKLIEKLKNPNMISNFVVQRGYLILAH